MWSTSVNEQETTRVLFSSLLPAARMATDVLTPLKEMKRLVELAYYREAKRRKLKMKEIRSLLSVSMSKVGLLSRQLKEHFAQPEANHEIPRRIMALLWAGPLSEKRIAQVLYDLEPEEVSAGIQQLVSQSKIVEEPGRTVSQYRLAKGQYRLVEDGWMAKIDALNNLLGSVSGAIKARFFNDDNRAFARTVGFRARPEDLGRLREAYGQLFELICELDEAVDGEETSVPISFSFLFAPDEGAHAEGPSANTGDSE